MHALSEDQPAIERIISALILGADHPITPSEIQRILETVDNDERSAANAETDEISDAELEATQAQTDHPTTPDGQTEEILRLESEGPAPISTTAIKRILEDMQRRFDDLKLGIELVEIAGAYRFQTDASCGKWVRRMLNKGKPARLPRSAIETLAIIAYRQPVTRSEIESIRGVGAGHVIKALMEMQLVRIIARSDLPGRPFLFGTTPTFLTHFGLSSLKDLDPMKQ